MSDSKTDSFALLTHHAGGIEKDWLLVVKHNIKVKEYLQADILN